MPTAVVIIIQLYHPFYNNKVGYNKHGGRKSKWVIFWYRPTKILVTQYFHPDLTNWIIKIRAHPTNIDLIKIKLIYELQAEKLVCNMCM